jgi:hypothetical protein
VRTRRRSSQSSLDTTLRDVLGGVGLGRRPQYARVAKRTNNLSECDCLGGVAWGPTPTSSDFRPSHWQRTLILRLPSMHL